MFNGIILLCKYAETGFLNFLLLVAVFAMINITIVVIAISLSQLFTSTIRATKTIFVESDKLDVDK